jgi:iron complex transport system substrate-binding protein
MFDTIFCNLNIRRRMTHVAPRTSTPVGLTFLSIPFCPLVLWLGVMAGGCNRQTPPAPAMTAKSPTVASLVPAATDLILGMGAGDHLVAVSNYDAEPAAAKLPRVGDYQAIDWEKLAQLRPNVIITYYGPGHIPPGFAERTKELGMQNLNLRFNRLTDVFEALGALGHAISERDKAQALAQHLRAAIQSLHAQSAAQSSARVRAVIVTDPSGLDFAGRDNYLDDLLEAVGGENAVTAPGYVALDREAIAALKPDVILQLMPGADDAAKRQAQAFWNGFADLPAVRNHRVYVFTEPYMVRPGAHIADVAAKFAAALHSPEEPASHPTTNNATH